MSDMRFRFGTQLLLALALFAGLPLTPVRGGTPADVAPPPVHVLTSGKLTVKVMDPNSPDRYNRGVRFTPVAAVLAVVLEGQSYLYAPKDHDPIEDDGGLASEFDLCIPGGPEVDLPSGYKEAKVGDGFLKIGVGVLQKDAETYNLFQQPKVIEPAKTTVQWGADSATYRQTCNGVNGYAYELWATVLLHDKSITVDWKLANNGSKVLTTKQYTHNFIRLGDHNVGPDYIVSFPYDFQARGLEAGQRQKGRGIQFIAEIQKWINAEVNWPQTYSGPNVCLVRQTVTGQSIRCETSLPGLRTAIHARAGFVSPEQFISITLNPGGTKEWRRTYFFGKNLPLLPDKTIQKQGVSDKTH